MKKRILLGLVLISLFLSIFLGMAFHETHGEKECQICLFLSLISYALSTLLIFLAFLIDPPPKRSQSPYQNLTSTLTSYSRSQRAPPQ